MVLYFTLLALLALLTLLTLHTLHTLRTLRILHTYLHTYFLCKYILTYILTYLHTYIHTYIHTYLHTYTQKHNRLATPKSQEPKAPQPKQSKFILASKGGQRRTQFLTCCRRLRLARRNLRVGRACHQDCCVVRPACPSGSH